jgi:hypothetical protein
VHQDTDTEVVVYVRLLDEGTDVWRPVRATALPDGTFRFQEPSGYDPDAETWEFPPLTKVRCATKKFMDGDEGLVAVARGARVIEGGGKRRSTSHATNLPPAGSTFEWTLDDFPHYAHNCDLGYGMPITSPQRAMEVFRSEFNGAWKYGALRISVWEAAIEFFTVVTCVLS